MAAPNLLSVEDLSVGFRTEAGFVHVVDRVSFAIAKGRTLGLVGESGCGKSVTAQTLLRLLPSPPARIEAGRILFEGRDLVQLDEADMREVRGNRIGMVFQEPMTSLNPTLTVGDQVSEALTLHHNVRRSDAMARVGETLRQVGIGGVERRLRQYPHELSGGLRQRVMIAMAIVCRPALLIADEPTTALDVTIQAQILDLLRRLREEFGLAMLLITHDLGIVSEICDDVAVMYAGRIVEEAPARRLFIHPRHPYTAGLLAASPGRARKGTRLPAIPGLVPPPGARDAGCSFAARCSRKLDRCRTDVPPLIAVGEAHRAACWNPVP